MLVALLANHGHRFFGERGWWLFGGLVPFLMLLALIGLAVWVVVRMTSRGSRALPATGPASSFTRPDGALEEVRLRYARGEISREEFLQRSQDLGGLGSPAGEPGPPSPG
jgi:putative membrane protein